MRASLGRRVLRADRVGGVRAGRLRGQSERRHRAANDVPRGRGRPRSSAASTARTSSATRSRTTTACRRTGRGDHERLGRVPGEPGRPRARARDRHARRRAAVGSRSCSKAWARCAARSARPNRCRAAAPVRGGRRGPGDLRDAGRPNKHEHICESIELFGERVLPQFSDGRDERERDKAARLAPAIERALARRGASGGAARLRDRRAGRAGAGGPARGGPAACVSALRSSARRSRRSLRKPGPGGVAPTRARRQRRAARAAIWQPRRAAGDLHGDGAPVRAALRLRIRGRHRLRARAPRRLAPGRALDRARRGWRRPGGDGRRRRSRGDVPPVGAGLARLLAEEADPQQLLFAGRFQVEGDLQLAMRVPEMFGAAPRF